ncbi:MAG: cytochrome c oxidase subunit II [Pseudomonadota bacterium]
MQFVTNTLRKASALAAVAGLIPATALAQEVAPETADAAAAPSAEAPAVADSAAPAAEAVAETATEAAGSYTPMAPTEGVGMPVQGGVDFQQQFSELGQTAYFLDTYILLPVITVISLFVLGLLIWVMVRYRAGANPTPSKTSHNTTIEVVWTLVPALILIGIAFPSLSLLAKQYETAPADAVTVKVTGYQWYWGYTYPDNGGFEVISNMMDEETANERGEPFQLAVDNRMVVPAGEPVKIITTAADVIHSFAVPSIWFKLDAVPGRLNEKVMQIDKPGVYYGQCSELCGARHGYMPIAVEALPRDEWEQWVLTQGGTVGEEEVADAPAAEPEAPSEGDAEAEAVETAALTN